MARENLQKEILVVTSSGTGKQQLCNLAPKPDMSLDSIKEELQEACWNGLLDEMLPLAFHSKTDYNELYLWELFVGEQTICAELSEKPFIHDSFHAINPFVFLCFCHYS